MIKHVSCEVKHKNIRVAIAHQCNLECGYCDGPKSRTADRPGAMEDFRRKPIEAGIITTEQYLLIFKSLLEAKFNGVTLTGGEPMMNKNWDKIAIEAKSMGYDRVEMTTNGMLILTYLKKHKRFPEELTLLKVSLDTHDPIKFKKITKVGSLVRIENGIRALKKSNPNLRIRTNKVLLRSDLPQIENYINYIVSLGIRETIFLDLILTDGHNNQSKNEFKSEYVYISEAVELLKKIYGDNLVIKEDRYGFKLFLPNGLSIVLKDSTGLTLRDEECDSCPIPCQEGLFTVRVATDGTMSPCFDTRNILTYSDAKNLSKDELNLVSAELFARLINADEVHYFDDFLNKVSVLLHSN